MEQAILEMQNDLTDGFFVAFVSENEDPYFALTKSDDVNFLDDKTVKIRKKNGRTTIINLNLIIEICIRRFDSYV